MRKQVLYGLYSVGFVVLMISVMYFSSSGDYTLTLNDASEYAIHIVHAGNNIAESVVEKDVIDENLNLLYLFEINSANDHNALCVIRFQRDLLRPKYRLVGAMEDLEMNEPLAIDGMPYDATYEIGINGFVKTSSIINRRVRFNAIVFAIITLNLVVGILWDIRKRRVS